VITNGMIIQRGIQDHSPEAYACASDYDRPSTKTNGTGGVRSASAVRG
jgi:hypothetical protein